MNLGGKEQAAIFGAVMACRVMRIPVIIDGYICSSSISPLYLLNEIAIENCIFSHYSREKGHKKLLSIMGKKAILDLGNVCQRILPVRPTASQQVTCR